MSKGGANFSSAELVRVLSHYDLGIIQKATPLSAGNMRAPKMIITSDKGKYLLKRRPKDRDDLYRVTFAHSVQMHLAQKKFPVAALIPTRDEKNTVLNLENHIYELFEFIPGARYDGSEDSAADAGRKLADFHRHLVDFSDRWKPLRGSFHSSPAVRGHIKAVGSEQSLAGVTKELRETTESLMNHYNKASVQVNSLGFDEWPEQIIHGDWHPGNMLFANSKVTAVLDFDSLKIAPLATDIANGMLQFSIVGGRPNPADWPDYLDESKLLNFLSGYRQNLKPAKNQISALLALMVEAMIAEAVWPVAATGFFVHSSGSDFLRMINRKCGWIDANREKLEKSILEKTAP